MADICLFSLPRDFQQLFLRLGFLVKALFRSSGGLEAIITSHPSKNHFDFKKVVSMQNFYWKVRLGLGLPPRKRDLWARDSPFSASKETPRLGIQLFSHPQDPHGSEGEGGKGSSFARHVVVCQDFFVPDPTLPCNRIIYTIFHFLPAFSNSIDLACFSRFATFDIFT